MNTQTKPQSTKAIFEARDVPNTFEQAIQRQHDKNYQKYLNTLKGKKPCK